MNVLRVLLVDGDLAFLDLLTDFLQQYGEVAVVGTASDNEESLTQAKVLQPEVVVIDLGTPGLASLALVSRLREMMPGVGIIATSLLRTNGYREAALAAGADDFVPKAALATDLLPAILKRKTLKSGSMSHESRRRNRETIPSQTDGITSTS